MTTSDMLEQSSERLSVNIHITHTKGATIPTRKEDPSTTTAPHRRARLLARDCLCLVQAIHIRCIGLTAEAYREQVHFPQQLESGRGGAAEERVRQD